jgi:hypothetical protein
VVEDAMLLVRGDYERDDETSRMKVAELTPLDVVRDRAVREVEIRLGAGAAREMVRRLEDVLERHAGDRRVSFVVEVAGGRPMRVRAGTARRIRPSEHFVREVESLCGPGSVRLRSMGASGRGGKGSDGSRHDGI